MSVCSKLADVTAIVCITVGGVVLIITFIGVCVVACVIRVVCETVILPYSIPAYFIRKYRLKKYVRKWARSLSPEDKKIVEFYIV
jgi:hypothetical protein